MGKLRFNKDNNYLIGKLEDLCFSESSNISQSSVENDSGEYPIYGANGEIKKISKYEKDFKYIGIVKDGAGVGRTILCDKKSSLIGTMQYIIPKKNVNIDYIYHNINYIDFTKYIVGSGIPHIYFKDYKNHRIKIHSYEEQEKIGGFLSAFDKLIEKQKERVGLLLKLKENYSINLFPSEDSNIPSLKFNQDSSDWKKVKLIELGKTYTGLSGKRAEDFGHGEAKYITYINVYNNTFSDLKGTEKIEVDNNQNKVKYGDIFFTVSSETADEVGMSSVWLGTEENIYLNSFCFGFRLFKEINYLFIGFCLRSKVFRKKMILLAQGISRYNISKNKVLELEIKIPCLIEQEKIGNFLMSVDKLIGLEESKLKKIELLKQGYMQRIFAD